MKKHSVRVQRIIDYGDDVLNSGSSRVDLLSAMLPNTRNPVKAKDRKHPLFKLATHVRAAIKGREDALAELSLLKYGNDSECEDIAPPPVVTVPVVVRAKTKINRLRSAAYERAETRAHRK
ncbi:MAG TPA: hypothetical protein VNT29_06765 [Candidatus Limnocylindrales bacterium]|nr:hypothetical protein [Candidatus Limnocylindrales bacterium]